MKPPWPRQARTSGWREPRRHVASGGNRCSLAWRSSRLVSRAAALSSYRLTTTWFPCREWPATVRHLAAAAGVTLPAPLAPSASLAGVDLPPAQNAVIRPKFTPPPPDQQLSELLRLHPGAPDVAPASALSHQGSGAVAALPGGANGPPPGYVPSAARQPARGPYAGADIGARPGASCGGPARSVALRGAGRAARRDLDRDGLVECGDTPGRCRPRTARVARRRSAPAGSRTGTWRVAAAGDTLTAGHALGSSRARRCAQGCRRVCVPLP